MKTLTWTTLSIGKSSADAFPSFFIKSKVKVKTTTRNVQISYIEVDGGDAGEELEDPYEGALPNSLPHTVESYKIRELRPAFPTDAVREQLSKEDMALHEEGELEEDADAIIDEAWKDTGANINQNM